MTNHPKVDIGCSLVGDFVDEGDVPEAFAHLRGKPSQAEVERPRVVADYMDFGDAQDGNREFTVLLHNDRIVTVRGHALQYLPNTANPSDYGTYGVLTRSGKGEILVALFRVAEVTGIFDGDIRLSRVSA
jgi:hypothetical protein